MPPEIEEKISFGSRAGVTRKRSETGEDGPRNQKQLRIKLETEAKLDIQERIFQKEIELVWSCMLDIENEANPFEQRKLAIRGWKLHAIADNESLHLNSTLFHRSQLISQGFQSRSRTAGEKVDL